MDPSRVQPPSGDGQRALPSAAIAPSAHQLARRLREHPAEPADRLATVVRDALDQTTEIARDAISLGALEAKHAARDLGPRVVWAGVALTFGFAGVVLGLIALFIGLGALLPPVGWRLALFALVF